MNNIPKIIVLLITCSFPLSALAAMGCAPNDIQCRQLQTMKKSGIKPTQLVEPQDFDASKARKQPVESQSYMVPPPGFSQTETEGESSDQEQDSETDHAMPINIFTPNTNKATKRRFKPKPLPLPLPPPITRGSTGIY